MEKEISQPHTTRSKIIWFITMFVVFSAATGCWIFYEGGKVPMNAPVSTVTLPRPGDSAMRGGTATVRREYVPDEDDPSPF